MAAETNRVSSPTTLWLSMIEVRNVVHNIVHRNSPRTAVRSQAARDPIPAPPRPTTLRQDIANETDGESAAADATRSPSPTR